MGKETEKLKIKIGIEGFDPLGLKSTGEIAKNGVEFGIAVTKDFLKATCRPLFEELGLLMKDKVTYWRLANIIKMLEKAQGKLQYDPYKEKVVIDPRIALQIAEHASIVENETLQDLWAGLFAASCQTYQEDENILFVEIVKRLTSSQVKLLNYMCKNVDKSICLIKLPEHQESGIINAGSMMITYDKMLEIMNTQSRLKADTEFIALENMGLISRPQRHIITDTRLNVLSVAGTKPTLMALRLFVKGQGATVTPFEYFRAQINDRYYQLIKDHAEVEQSEALTFVYKQTLQGKALDGQIDFTASAIRINDPALLDLPLEVLNDKLRAYLIYRKFHRINQQHTIHYNSKDYGTFDYKRGLKVTFSEDTIN